MPLPLIAAGIAARVVAKKLATRVAGGIVGAGAKSVNPVYRNTSSVKVIPDLKEDAQALGLTKKQWQSTVNKGMTDMTKRNKSGQSAKEVAAWRAVQNKSIPKKPTVKINSNPTRAK